jgi:hypothetical protein
MSILKQTQGFNVTDRYTPVTTQNLIDTLTKKGYVQTALKTTRVRKSSKEGFQKHMVRLSHEGLTLQNVGDSRPEIVLVNSYDGSSCLKIMIGIFRLVCSNGMIVGKTFGEYSVRHVGDITQQIDQALLDAATRLPAISEKISQFTKLQLTDAQQNEFAKLAAALILPENAQAVDLKSVLKITRQGDAGSDFWTVFNRAQEKLLNGGVAYTSLVTDEETQTFNVRHNTSRAIKSIDRQVSVNQGVWDLAEQFYKQVA